LLRLERVSKALIEYSDASVVEAKSTSDALVRRALRACGRNIARGAGRGGKSLGLLPFERGGGGLALTVQGVGQDRVGLSIVWICVDCCLKLDESISDLT
jgi:hypothetical protein